MILIRILMTLTDFQRCCSSGYCDSEATCVTAKRASTAVGFAFLACFILAGFAGAYLFMKGSRNPTGGGRVSPVKNNKRNAISPPVLKGVLESTLSIMLLSPPRTHTQTSRAATQAAYTLRLSIILTRALYTVVCRQPFRLLLLTFFYYFYYVIKTRRWDKLELTQATLTGMPIHTTPTTIVRWPSVT